MHHVYVLKSEKDGKLYVGCTSDLTNRLELHANGKVPSTKGRRPLVLVHCEPFADKYEAFRKECFYKTAKGKRSLQEIISRILSSGVV